MSDTDFTGVKGVYKNCRGIWAAQWTDENGQRHTKYFNPKFFPSEATAKLEAYKFKVQIQKEIERKGGVSRRRNASNRRTLNSATTNNNFSSTDNISRRIRRTGKLSNNTNLRYYQQMVYYPYNETNDNSVTPNNWGWFTNHDDASTQVTSDSYDHMQYVQDNMYYNNHFQQQARNQHNLVQIQRPDLSQLYEKYHWDQLEGRYNKVHTNEVPLDCYSNNNYSKLCSDQDQNWTNNWVYAYNSIPNYEETNYNSTSANLQDDLTSSAYVESYFSQPQD